MKRFSKKRQDIYYCLKSTDTHPSAEWVYYKLKNKYPDLSLGTVYRNINELESEGKICSVGVVGNKERFDGRTEPHTHLICRKCGKIMDANTITLPDDLLKTVNETVGFATDYSKIELVGLCADCLKSDA